ncbi:head-tail connector protein [Hirschia maritima]|uniref:head-tail connector protein n=1 Tax=Hirschia maritima TaxID=1121961 RepID=UPI000381C96C|nr:hypothetical protein [Hirschia maritima]
MKITTLVPPVGEPVALAAGKAFLRIDYEGEDTKVSSLISSARARVEVETGLRLVERTVKLELSCWPANELEARTLELPIGPVSSIQSVMIDGEDFTSRFVLQKGNPDRLKFRGTILPIAQDGFEISLIAGFGPDEGYVPADLKLAVKLLAAESYSRTNSSEDLSTDVAALLAPWRRVSL